MGCASSARMAATCASLLRPVASDPRVMPFFNAPCDPDTAPGIGWFDAAGVTDFKSQFELASRGFMSCSQCPGVKCIADGESIARHPSARSQTT